LSSGKSDHDPLVDSARGQFVNMHNWRSRVWNKAVFAAQLADRNRTPKALRHTAASRSIAAGADVKVVQRMLGHADASMTLNTYADLWPDRLDEVSKAVSRHRETAPRLIPS
jgi:integrase